MVRAGDSEDGAPELRRVWLGRPTLDEVEVVVRRTARSGNVRINVDETGVVSVTVPPRLAGDRIDRIVRERAAWLEEVVARSNHVRRATEVDLRRGDPVRYRGRWLPTRIVPLSAGRGRCRLVEDDGRMEILLPGGADPYELLHRWYRSQARDVITERVEYWADVLGLTTGSLSIRDQRTRWGSCTHRGDLSFNWRLLLAPDWVMDSIVVHELCHIVELNHSDRFWSLLDAAYPRHREASEWLAEHGAALRMSAPQRDPYLAAVAAATKVPQPATTVSTGRRRRRRSRELPDTQSELF